MTAVNRSLTYAEAREAARRQAVDILEGRRRQAEREAAELDRMCRDSCPVCRARAAEILAGREADDDR